MAAHMYSARKEHTGRKWDSSLGFYLRRSP